MGNANSVSEEDPSAIPRDEEITKTLIEEEDSNGGGDCELCRYVKGGACKDAFMELEKCVKNGSEASDVVVEKCKELRLLFKTCIFENADYYDPIISVEAKAIAKALHEEPVFDGDAMAIAKVLNGLGKEIESAPFLDAEAAAIGKALKELEVEKKQMESKESN